MVMVTGTHENLSDEPTAAPDTYGFRSGTPSNAERIWGPNGFVRERSIAEGGKALHVRGTQAAWQSTSS